MTETLKTVVLDTFCYEYDIKKESIKEYIDEQTGMKYISGVDRKGIASFITLDFFETYEKVGAQTQIMFDADQKVLENEDSMRLIKELMHDIVSKDEYDIDKTPTELHRFANKEYIKQFNKAGYAFHLGNGGDPFYIDDDIGEEYTGFFMFHLVFFNKEEMSQLEKMNNENDRLDYVYDQFENNDGNRLI